MPLFTIDPEKCDRDGRCVRDCPVKIIVQPEKGAVPAPAPGADKLCIDCGHCVSVCKPAALSLATMAPEDLAPLRDELTPSPESVEQLLKGRRSVRQYKDKPVDKETIAKLIEVARYAPTGHNSQGVDWAVILDRADLKKYGDMVVDYMKMLLDTNPVLAKSVNMDRVVAGWSFGIDSIFRDAPHLVIAHGDRKSPMSLSSCTIALTYLELAAASLGLGACWCGFFTGAAQLHKPIQEVLGLPAGNQVMGSMMVGYPAVRYRRIPKRKEPEILWR